jgi:PQQ-like domain
MKRQVMVRKGRAVRPARAPRRGARKRAARTARGARAASRRLAWLRRGVLAVALVAVVFFPVSVTSSGQQPAACRGCRVQPASAERWTAQLAGTWAVAAGATGTVPVGGQAYVAAGDGIAAVGDGLTLTGYRLRDGRRLWQAALGAPAGSAIISVRAWPGVVTAGILAPGGRTRTEVVLDSGTGVVVGRYPAAVFGGAVAASAATTVVVGPDAVTSYVNGTGTGQGSQGSQGRSTGKGGKRPKGGQGPTIRWQRPTGAAQSWRADGSTLYVAESAGGYLGSAPVTGLHVIDLSSGAEGTLRAPPGHTFAGTMALAADGVVLFTSATGVTAYNGSTGDTLWSVSAAVPEGADPAAGLIYLTVAGGALVGVAPLTGAVRASVSGATAGGSAGIYVVRGGVALGLDEGQGGEAWGYNTMAGRVTWTAAGLPWPHYFADLSGLGGSADESGDTVVVAVCAKLAPASAGPASPATTAPTSTTPTATAPTDTAPTDTTPSDTGSAGSSPTGSPSQSAAPVQRCAAPELVALSV